MEIACIILLLIMALGSLGAGSMLLMEPKESFLRSFSYALIKAGVFVLVVIFMICG
jgi:hypothetical protein